MAKPIISVIMSLYNSEKHVAEAIISILKQSFRSYELIIINDASTDTSGKIVAGYRNQDDRIITIMNTTNSGPAITRNKGLKIAQGKYIAILDSDDISLPERLKTQYDYLEKNPSIFLVGSGALEIDDSGNTIRKQSRITQPWLLARRLPYKNNIYHSSFFFRNEGNHFYRDKFLYSQDYDFLLCLLSEGKKLSNIKDTLIKYRITSDAISFSKSAKQSLFAEQARLFYRQRIKYGKDEYDQFNPEDILNYDSEKAVTRRVVEAEIKASLKINDFKRAEYLYRTYFQRYGYLNLQFYKYILFEINAKLSRTYKT